MTSKQSTFNHIKRKSVAIVIALFFLIGSSTLKAQQEEILLTFRYPAVGNVYVNCSYDYKTNSVLLPILELFDLLEINYQPDIRSFTVSGNFITKEQPYIINLASMYVQLGKVKQPIKPEDFRISETEFYLSPKIFEEVFGLKFTVEIAPLLLNLETTTKLPVQDRKAREAARTRMEGSELNQENYPIGYDRKRSIFGGTMIDYAITGTYAADAQSVGYTITGGFEALGGDIQGTVNGINSTNGEHAINMNGLRWRYAVRDNNYLSGIMLGQISTTGLQPMSIKGISISNDPIEPRQMYETTMVDGTTEPNSEVEIYVNDRLAGFKRADELGYYRFDIPITYGTTRISLRIFTPTGNLIVTDRQMQVPFTFLPRGVITYNIQAGEKEDYLSDITLGRWTAHGNIAMGLTNWLTASAGTQFLENTLSSDKMMFYSSLSARIAKQYLINIDAAPNNFYRFTGSVMYTNNLNLNLIYTRFDGKSMFNARGETDNVSANIYLPFKIFNMNTGLRISGEHFILPDARQTIYSTDFGARFGYVNMRLNYRDNFSTSNAGTAFGNGLLTTALTYTISRTPGIPVFVRGMYIRVQNQYNIRKNELVQSELNFSRTVLKTGRLNMILGYNHLTNMVNTQVGFTLDLNFLRSTTTLNTTGNKLLARQSVNGSIGWDMPNNAIVVSNRQQVSRAAASVVMFVDNNNSGHYDAGDQLLPYRAIKLDRSTTMELGRDSILRLSQLQSYYKYNLSVNRNAIGDPTLVPVKDKFSFIADPNQYKRIEIPFYRGGIIEGAVLIIRNGATTGQGGLRLLIKSDESDFETIIRTMNDGSFYTMDLAPGKYTIEVDSVQLGFLNVKQQSEKTNFEIKALSEGDYVDGLNIILVPIANEIPDNNLNLNEKAVEENTIVKTEVTELIIEENNKQTETSTLAVYPIAQPSLWINNPIPPISSSPVKYPMNSSYLTPEFKQFLDTIVIALNQISWKSLTIYGNSDGTGDPDYNYWISLRRAERVKEYLVKKQIPSNKIEVISNGANNPVSTNKTLEGRILNRRIEIKIQQAE